MAHGRPKLKTDYRQLKSLYGDLSKRQQQNKFYAIRGQSLIDLMPIAGAKFTERVLVEIGRCNNILLALRLVSLVDKSKGNEVNVRNIRLLVKSVSKSRAV